MTHLEEIKSMNSKELAEILAVIGACELCSVGTATGVCIDSPGYCVAHIEEYLNSEG